MADRRIEVRFTPEFVKWVRRLRDEQAKSRIAMRLERLEAGHLGDAKLVGAGVGELRIDDGPGYRLYFTRRGSAIILLLCGGDKSSQDRDIVRAKAMAASLRDLQ